MLGLIVPTVFVGCMGIFGILMSLYALIIIIRCLWKSDSFEDNMGWFVIAFGLFILSIVVNIISWGIILVGR
jgi:hypothetical protein